jgi:hypothetical protein
MSNNPPKNDEVKKAFLKKKKLKGTALTSDGTSLWSYGWWEIARWVKGRVILRSGRSYSRTTEVRHRRGVPGALAKKESPKEQGAMNL